MGRIREEEGLSIDPEGERNAFAEAVSDLAAVDAPTSWKIDDGFLQKVLQDADDEIDPEDREHARERAEYFSEIVNLLVASASTTSSYPGQAQEVLDDAKALATFSAQELLLTISRLGLPGEKGDLFGAISALVEATFYIGRTSSTLQEKKVKEQTKKRGRRGASERTLCKAALRSLYETDPVVAGLGREAVLTKVNTLLPRRCSLITLDRARKEIWRDKN